MGKLKIPDSELDVKALDVEWSDQDFVKYEGEVPETGQVLNGFIKKMWWTYSSDNTPMIKVLFEADDTSYGGEYEGCPIWENLVLKPACAFRYGPFLQFFGLSLADIKNKTYVEDKDDSNGAPITKIAEFEPGAEYYDAMCAVAVKRSKYNGEWKPEVGEWLEYDADREEEGEEEPEEEPEPPKTRSRGSKPDAKSAASSSNGAASSRTRARAAVKEAVEEEAEEEEEEEAEAEAPPPKRPAARTKASASKPAAAAKPAARTSRRRPAKDDDIPF